MNSMERVKAALECRPYDRVPVFPQVGDHAGHLLEYDITEMFDDVSKAVEAHLFALDMYGYDVVTIQVETSWPIIEACGGTVTYPEGKAPWITRHPITDAAEIDNLSVPNFHTFNRVANILEGTKRLKNSTGVPVAAFVTGPITMGFHLFGYEEAVKIISKDKDFLPHLTKKSTQIILTFASTIKEAGADILVICEHDAQMVSPMYIKKFCVPNLQPILEVFNYNMLHMCGRVNKQLEMNIEEIKALSGLNAVSVGPEIDMQALRTLLGNSIGVVGNIDHINVLPNSSPEEIDTLCKKVIEENKHSPGFMLAPGCEITVDTPKDNVKAFVDAAPRYGIVN